MNGSGKTSLMEAISVCLYCEKFDLIYKSINRHEFSKGNKRVTFELTLETDDEEAIVINRSYSNRNKDNTKPTDFIENLIVTKNGSQVSSQNKDLWQDFINSTIPKSITQFFFFDGEKIQEIAADDHSEVRLKSSLEAALGIKYITHLSSDILHVKQKERQSFIEVTDDEIEIKENNLKLLNNRKSKLESSRIEIKEEIDNLLKNHESIKKRFNLTFGRDPEQREEIKTREQKKIQESSKLSKVDFEIKEIIEQQLPFALGSELFKGLKEQIEHETKVQTDSTLSLSANLISQKALEALFLPTPLVDKAWSADKKETFRKRLEKLISNLTYSDRSEKILDLTEREAAQILLLIKDLEQGETHRLSELIDEKRTILNTIDQIESDYSPTLSENEENLFNQMQDELDSLSTQIGRKKEELRGLEEELINLDSQISIEEETISKLYDRHSLSREKSDFLNECERLSKMLNEYVVLLRDRKIGLLREKTFEMYKRLSSKSDLISDIIIDNSTYEIVIRDTKGKEIRKSGLSAGEKEIFAVSLLWGLAQTSQIKLPIIIDTPLSRLDSTHRDNIVERYFPSAGEQVVILSTDTEVDNTYYEKLEKYLTGAGQLVFDKNRQLTVFKKGYFWSK